MNLEEMIKKYQDIYYKLQEPTHELQNYEAQEIAKNVANDLIAFQDEIKDRLDLMKSPRSHLNPVLILKELIE